MADRCPTDVKYEFNGMGMDKLQLRPCGLLGWVYCNGYCNSCQATVTTTHTPYDPIEIARQYAPKFDKPVVDMMEKSIAEPYIEFCEWVADTVLYEDFEDKWTLGAFAEVACRKLYKLGFVRKDGEYWVKEKDEVKRMAEYIYEIKHGDGYTSTGVKQKLVRCKECKYRYGDKDEPYCDRINPYNKVRVEDDDFCSWGEKNG